MTAVSPYFYVIQALYFTLGAILLGIFANFLRNEVQLNGWGLTPRLVRSLCLVCSSLGFVIVQLDTFGALGMYSDPWQLALGHIDGSLLIGAVCSSLYLYVLISFKAESVPLVVVRIWIASNVGGLLIVFGNSMFLGATGNMFWSYLCTVTLLVQEILLYMGFLIVVCRTTRVLKAMGHTMDYKAQIYKLWKVMFCAACVFTLAFAIQTPKLGTVFWGNPVPVSNLEEFKFALMVPDLVLLAGHLVVLFMLRPPKSRTLTIARIRLGPDQEGGKGTHSRSSKTRSSKETNSKSSKATFGDTVTSPSTPKASCAAAAAASKETFEIVVDPPSQQKPSVVAEETTAEELSEETSLEQSVSEETTENTLGDAQHNQIELCVIP